MRAAVEYMYINGVEVEVVRKDIQNLYIRIYPPNGHVKVTAPLSISDREVTEFVCEKQDWITETQEKIRNTTDIIRMVSGEIHYLWGKKYILSVIEHNDRPMVRLVDDNFLEMRVRPGTDGDMREQILYEWYREQLIQEIPALVEKWETIIGVTVAEWRIKRMKTRWGTCNTRARRIWINLELVRKPPLCLEYILAHELLHFRVCTHQKEFWKLMDDLMPDWRAHREELRKPPLPYKA